MSFGEVTIVGTPEIFVHIGILQEHILNIVRQALPQQTQRMIGQIAAADFFTKFG
jgi:hypothetical protein